jgi:hypothetical protein
MVGECLLLVGELPLDDIPHFPYRRRRRFSQLAADPATDPACRFSATDAASAGRFSAIECSVRRSVVREGGASAGRCWTMEWSDAP